MTEKLSELVSLRLAISEYRQLGGLADMAGLTVSGYVRHIIEGHLAQERLRFESMRQVFDHTANSANSVNKS